MSSARGSTSSTRPAKVPASDGQHGSGRASKSEMRPNASSPTHSKVSTASSKSSTASTKSTSSRKGAESDTKRKPSASTSKDSFRRRSTATTKSSAHSPESSSKKQRLARPSADAHQAPANTDDTKKPVESKSTKKSATKRKPSEEAVPPVRDAGAPHQVSSKASQKSTDHLKTKSHRDAAEEGVEKKASSKVSGDDKPGEAADKPIENDGNRSVKGDSRKDKMTFLAGLIKRKSIAAFSVAGGALSRRASQRPPPSKSKTPVESVGHSKVEVSDARASLARLAAMNEESGHSELDSQQQRCLALGGALSLTLLMIIFFSVVSYVLRSGAPTIRVACETSECAAAKAYVEGLLGDPKHRCADFYNYVCGQMITNRTSASVDALERLHKRLIGDTQRKPDKLGGHVAARVYSSCQEFLDLTATPAGALQEAGRTIKSDQLRGANTFAQIIKVLVSVSLQRGLHTVIEIGLVRYIEGANVSLRLSPGRSIQRKFIKDSRKDLEQNLRAAFAWAPEVSTDEAVSLVLAVDKSVEEAFMADDVAGDDREESGPFRSFVSDMLPVVGTVVWVSAVTASNPDSFVASTDTPCYATSLKGARGAFRELVSVGVRRAASYLAANLEAEIAIFEHARQSLKADAAGRRRFCLDATRRCMLFAWHILTATILKASGHDGEVKDMFGALRHVFWNSGRSALFTWLDPSVRAAAMKRLEDTTVTVVGTEEESKRSTIDYGYFTPTVTEPKDFVDAYLSTLRQTQKMQTTAPLARWQVVYANMELIGTVVYDYRLGAIVVPPVMLMEPYFYGSALPMHFDYGTIGALLAVRMAQIVGAESSRTSGKNTRALGRQGNPPATNASNSRHRSIQCLRELRLQLDPAARSQTGQEDILLAWMQGLRAAYEALLIWFTEESGDPEVFSRYWPAAQVLFFARFCLLSCGGVQRRYTGATHVPPRHRCLLPLHNMPQFAEAFECGGSHGFVAGACRL